MSFLKYLSSAFSQHKTDKLLYRTIRELKPRNIVELGIGDGERSSQILTAAGQHKEVNYCGIDMFEAAPAGSPHLSLKQAHQKLSSLQGRVRLLPGDAPSTLRRCANELMGTDLLVISAPLSEETLETIWSYAPRMLQETSKILVETTDSSGWNVMTLAELPKVELTRRKRSAA